MLLLQLLVGVASFVGGLHGDEHVVVKRQANETVTLRVVSIATKPYVSVTEDGTYDGFIPQLMDEVARMLQVNYELHLVKDGMFGGKKADGTWDGMVGELTRQEADIAAAPLTITSMRERVVDFTKPFMSVGITTLFQRPRNEELTPFFWLLSPFSTGVWIVVLVASVLSCIALYLLNRFLPKPKPKDRDAEGDAEGDAGDAAAATAVCCVDCREVCSAVSRLLGIQGERSVSVSVLIVSWRVFVLLTAALYVSSLLSFSASWLSETQVLPPYSNINELAASDVSMGYVKGGSTESFFRVSKVPVYEQIYSRVSNAIPSTVVTTIEEGIAKVQKGGYALIGESTTFEYATLMTCDLMTIGGNINAVGYGLATPLDSDFRDMLNLAVLQLQETGKLAQLQRKWWHERGQCEPMSYTGPSQRNKIEPKARSVSLHQFVDYGSLVFLAVGLVLTAVAAVVEIVLVRKQQRDGTKKPSVTSDAATSA